MILHANKGARAFRRVPAPHSTAAFSLVEVTLAVAIAALAVITLLGLLPQGLEMSRKTALLTSNNSILEQIIRNLENLQWSSLPADGQATTIKKYFTDQGMEVAADSKDISFVAEIAYQATTSLPRPVDESDPGYLRRVVIKVGPGSGASYAFGTENRQSYVIFNHLIAKTR